MAYERINPKKTINMRKIVIPTAPTILLILAGLVAILTHFLPAGAYDKLIYDAPSKSFYRTGVQTDTLVANQKTLDDLGLKIPIKKFTAGEIWKPIGIPGTYRTTTPKPQGFLAFLQAPLLGITAAFDVILFVLILGGAIGVVNATGAFNAGIGRLAEALRGREFLLIIIITSLMAAGGTTFGLAEETIAFYPILVPVFLAAGYDALVAVACIYIGSNLGTLGSTVNPFSAIIGSNAAGINWLAGINIRLMMLLIGLAVSLAFILRYARKVKADPTKSLIFAQKVEIEERFLKKEAHENNFGISQKLVLVLFASCFLVMIYGVSSLDWWFTEMTTVFFVGALLIGLLSRIGEKTFIEAFIKGTQDLIGVAFIIGIARGVTVLMENGQIADTILHASANLVGDLPKVVFIHVLHFIFMGLSLFIPSSSGMAVLTMPVFAPLADVLGMGRELIVASYIFGQGIMAFINPTGLILASLAMVNISFGTWFKFIKPLLLILFLLATVILTFGIF